jgi:hypothetical protein
MRTEPREPVGTRSRAGAPYAYTRGALVKDARSLEAAQEIPGLACRGLADCRPVSSNRQGLNALRSCEVANG